MTIKVIQSTLILLLFISCSSNKKQHIQQNLDTTNLALLTDTLHKQKDIYESDTAIILNKKFVWTIYQNDTSCFFIVQKEINGHFKTIMKDPEFTTNNSGLTFKDINNDGYLDILKGNQFAYLFNPKIENFIEAGECHNIDTLKIRDIPILYKNQYPLLYYLSYGKAMAMEKCNDDTMLNENYSELFIINDKYEKVSFATLDNFETFDDKKRDTLECGSQIINCYIPPYYGKYGEYSVWNSGKSVDSFWLANNNSFYHDDFNGIDSTFITSYWLTNYFKLLQYGQIFKVRREKQIEYYN